MSSNLPNNKRLSHTKESQAADGATKINVNEEMDGVEVRWMFEPSPVGKHSATMEASPGVFREVRGDHSYKVIVRSVRFPHSKMVGEIRPEDVTSIAKIGKHVGILAGALTEELNERFSDNVDPAVIARNAVEAFKEMMQDQRRALLQATD